MKKGILILCFLALPLRLAAEGQHGGPDTEFRLPEALLQIFLQNEGIVDPPNPHLLPDMGAQDWVSAQFAPYFRSRNEFAKEVYERFFEEVLDSPRPGYFEWGYVRPGDEVLRFDPLYPHFVIVPIENGSRGFVVLRLVYAAGGKSRKKPPTLQAPLVDIDSIMLFPEFPSALAHVADEGDKALIQDPQNAGVRVDLRQVNGTLVIHKGLDVDSAIIFDVQNHSNPYSIVPRWPMRRSLMEKTSFRSAFDTAIACLGRGPSRFPGADRIFSEVVKNIQVTSIIDPLTSLEDRVQRLSLLKALATLGSIYKKISDKRKFLLVRKIGSKVTFEKGELEPQEVRDLILHVKSEIGYFERRGKEPDLIALFSATVAVLQEALAYAEMSQVIQIYAQGGTLPTFTPELLPFLQTSDRILLGEMQTSALPREAAVGTLQYRRLLPRAVP